MPTYYMVKEKSKYWPCDLIYHVGYILFCSTYNPSFYMETVYDKYSQAPLRRTPIYQDILHNTPMTAAHDDVIKWEHFLRHWPFVASEYPHKSQWSGAFIFSLICAWTNGWVNIRYPGDLRRHQAHYDITVMRTWVRLEIHNRHPMCELWGVCRDDIGENWSCNNGTALHALLCLLSSWYVLSYRHYNLHYRYYRGCWYLLCCILMMMMMMMLMMTMMIIIIIIIIIIMIFILLFVIIIINNIITMMNDKFRYFHY